MDREALSQSQQPDKPKATKDLRIPREDWLTNIGARIPIAALHDLMVRPSECARCFVSLQEPAGADILVVGALCTKPPPSTLTLAIAAVVVVSHSRYYLSSTGHDGAVVGPCLRCLFFVCTQKGLIRLVWWQVVVH
jgi:hypothetical protein